MRWVNTIITIKTRDKVGQKTIKVRCKGIFAIHDNLDNPIFKTLTHIPSGRSIILGATTGQLYRAAKQLSLLDWEGVEANIKPPKTFDLEKFRDIQRQYG